MYKFVFRRIFNPYLMDVQLDLRPSPCETDAITALEGLRGNHLLTSLTDSTKYRDKIQPSNSAKIRCSFCQESIRS